jgi:hypothetical protein
MPATIIMISPASLPRKNLAVQLCSCGLQTGSPEQALDALQYQS